MFIETAKSVLGPKERLRQDWFNNNDKQFTQLLQEKKAPSLLGKHLKEQAQTKLRERTDTWWDRKAEEVQMYADTHNSKQFVCALKAVYRPSKSGSTSLQSADESTLIKDQEGLKAVLNAA